VDAGLAKLTALRAELVGKLRDMLRGAEKG
jgi:hypothetical protein